MSNTLCYNTSMTRRGHPSSGFTIVELLIVIVVIAVLAAISVVAFVGVQARAENTKTINAVAAIARSLTALAAENGTYPGPAGGIWTCLPTDSVYCGTSQNDPSCFGLNRTPRSDTLANYLLPIASTIPQPSAQEIECASGKVVTGGFYRAEPGNKMASISYFLKGDVVCGGIGGLTVHKTLQASATKCLAVLPSIP